MKLFTKEIERGFKKQGYTGEKSAEDIKIICKLFNPIGVGTWYLYEKEDDDIYMAFVKLHDAEMAESGRVSLRELKNLRLPMGLSVERDKSFDVSKYTLAEVRAKIRSGGHI